jgi:SAM-dependent methyltransferase
MNCNIKIVCPACSSKLDNPNEGLVCVSCGKRFPLIYGIPSFTEENTLFEGRFVEHISPSRFENTWLYSILEKVDITRRRISFLKKCLESISRKSLILDVGCGGGGWGMILKRYGTVIGIDVSVGSLKYAQDIYKNLVHASATQIPFPSEYFDAVVSEDVLGHIPLAEKERAYSEMYRVLKPDGLMVHSAIETDSKSFWFKFAKKYPDLFKTHHIDKHGHIGLELASVIIGRCLKIGFDVKKVDPMHAIVLYPSLFSAWFDNGYKNENILISALVSFSRVIEKSKRITLVTNLALGIVEKMINPFINIDQAAGLLLCCKK